jgi:hypothetical protein
MHEWRRLGETGSGEVRVRGAVPGATLCRPREAFTVLLGRSRRQPEEPHPCRRAPSTALSLSLSLSLSPSPSLHSICTQDVCRRRWYSCTAADIGRPCGMTTIGARYPAQLPHLHTLTTTSHVASLQHRIAHVQLPEGCISLRMSPFHFCFSLAAYMASAHSACI